MVTGLWRRIIANRRQTMGVAQNGEVRVNRITLAKKGFTRHVLRKSSPTMHQRSIVSVPG